MAHQDASPMEYAVALVGAGVALLGFAASRGFFAFDARGLGWTAAMIIGTYHFATTVFGLDTWSWGDGRPWYARSRALFIIPIVALIPSYALAAAYVFNCRVLDASRQVDFRAAAGTAAGMMCIWIVLLDRPRETRHTPYVPPRVHTADHPFDQPAEDTGIATEQRKHMPPGRYIPRRGRSRPPKQIGRAGSQRFFQ